MTIRRSKYRENASYLSINRKKPSENASGFIFVPLEIACKQKY